MNRAIGGALVGENAGEGAHSGLRAVLGAEQWMRLPEAVRERFAENAARGRLRRRIRNRARQPARPAVRVARRDLRRARHAAQSGMTSRHASSCTPTGSAWNGFVNTCWADGAARRGQVHQGGQRGRATHREAARADCACRWRPEQENGVLHFVSRGYYFDDPVSGSNCGCPDSSLPGSRTSSTSTWATAGFASP